jgi:hypothetical protein
MKTRLSLTVGTCLLLLLLMGILGVRSRIPVAVAAPIPQSDQPTPRFSKPGLDGTSKARW